LRLARQDSQHDAKGERMALKLREDVASEASSYLFSPRFASARRALRRATPAVEAGGQGYVERLSRHVSVPIQRAVTEGNTPEEHPVELNGSRQRAPRDLHAELGKDLTKQPVYVQRRGVDERFTQPRIERAARKQRALAVRVPRSSPKKRVVEHVQQRSQTLCQHFFAK
jgi:hypothetical protein